MIKIFQGQSNNTYAIENGDCRPRNICWAFTLKDLEILFKKIAKILIKNQKDQTRRSCPCCGAQLE